METPEFFHEPFTSEKRHSDHFTIDDLLNFPTDDAVVDNDDVNVGDATYLPTSTDDSSNLTTTLDSPTPFPFTHDLCVPYDDDDMAELEWVSNFVEDSFSSEDMEKLQLISGIKPRPGPQDQDQDDHHHSNNPIFNTVPAKARTKRSRAAPCNWTSRLLVLSPTSVSSESDSDIVSSSIGNKSVKVPAPKKKEVYDNVTSNNSSEERKCLHCATDKTPQWRTGPLGPKTLCNACGVRYKSGRLVPEYRPAASPTFVLTKHSNSHRKVLELRRQKEVQHTHTHTHTHTHPHPHQPFFHHQNMMFDVSKGDDYLIHQHIGPDFRQLI